MWTPSYDIIVETLTGSEFEVTVNDRNTVGYLKSEIQKYEGIPISQQHLLYNHKELKDSMEMKEIPLVKGSRVKLVLGMKGGPISSKRLFTISPDYDNWLDMNDVLSGEDLINLPTPGLKLLLYKDNKKNVHRLMKVRAEKASDGLKGSLSRSIIGSGASGQGTYGAGSHLSQKERYAALTKQRMEQIKAKLSMKKKRLGAAHGGAKMAGDENGPQEQLQQLGMVEPALEDRAAACYSNDVGDAGAKAASRTQNQYRQKKRHHHYHHHHHHQHETVIKEEKTPIGYRPGTGGSGIGAGGGAALIASGHNAPMVGAIGSLLSGRGPGASATHRKSMPAVIDFERSEQEQTMPPFGYGLVNLMHGGSTATTSGGRTPSLELEKRSQIREHLQRNRSFKTISAKNLDFTRDGSPQVGMSSRLSGSAGLERSPSFHSETMLDGGHHSGIRRCTGGNGIGGQLRSNHTTNGPRFGGPCTTQSLHKLDESRCSSTSLHDLIELLKYRQSKQRTISNDSLNKLVLNYSKKVYVPHQLYHHHMPAVKKSLPDINPSLNNIDEYLPDYDFGLTTPAHGPAASTATTTVPAMPKMVTRSDDGLDCKIASAEYAFKNAGSAGGSMDKTFRTLYKSTSDDSSVYELPKLLIREDSPVESFLGSYSQLETVTTRRGDSPKNNFTSTGNLLQDEGTGATATDNQHVLPEPPGILELRTPPLGSTSPSAIIGDPKLGATESLLQLAQFASENVKSGGSDPATSSLTTTGTMFGSNVNLTASTIAASGSMIGGAASNEPTTWCHHWNQRQQPQQRPELEGAPSTSVSLHHLNNPLHHRSDLGINELELKFVTGGSNDVTDEANSEYTNMIKLPAITNLGASSGWLQLSSWDTVRFGREDDDDADDEEVLDEEEYIVPGREVNDEEEDDEDEDGCIQNREKATSSSCSSIQRTRDASNSTSFIHSHLSISSDEDDLLNVAELREGACVVGGGGAYKPGGNKSKSIDLNEFRKAFGSSPTLLNGFGGGGTSCTRLVPQLSRLETIPSQYRRGYTNLNDACLSSSTSELECVSNGSSKKKHHPGLLPPPGDDSGALSSTLLKYRKDGSVPYVRSSENLNRYKVSLCTGSATSRRMGDSDEALGGGSDALYLRQRQPSSSSAGAAGRHLPGIRDHLASIADAEVYDPPDDDSDRSKFTDENGNANRCYAVGGDLEWRFSRLHCCQVNGGKLAPSSSKPVSPGVSNRAASGSGYRPKEHSSAVGGGGGMMRTASSGSRGDHTRFLFGEDGASLQYNGGAASSNSSSTPMRPLDYYFPSDESLFNMDSFFDDFVEIDTSDIFDSAEFININAGDGDGAGTAGRKGDIFGAAGSLVLPDIHPKQQKHRQQFEQLQQKHQQLMQQREQRLQMRHEQQYPYYAPEDNVELKQQQYRLLNNFKTSGIERSDDARKQFYRSVGLRGGTESSDARDGGIHFSARRAFLRAGQPVNDDDEEEEEGIASIIQHIDREQLCEQRASSADAAVASSIVVHDDRERLLRLSDFPSERNSVIGGAGDTYLTQQQHTATTTTTPPAEQMKSKKLRCAQCNKKLGVIMIMRCHCEKIFCAQHRYAEAHDCSYNFKVEGRKVLEKNNPLVVADKLPKI